jgi:hypothetical protein
MAAAPQQLTRVPGYYRDVNFSPDGKRIVAVRAPRQGRVEQFDEWDSVPVNLDLIWLSADGGDANLILPARGAAHPHFGPEPERVYVYSENGLMSLRYDGTDRRTILKVVARSGFRNPTNPTVRPPAMSASARRQVGARPGQQPGVPARGPRMGGEAVTVDVSKPPVPLRKITEVGGDYMSFANGGNTVTWSEGSTFFRLPLDRVEFEPPRAPEDESGKKTGTRHRCQRQPHRCCRQA